MLRKKIQLQGSFVYFERKNTEAYHYNIFGYYERYGAASFYHGDKKTPFDHKSKILSLISNVLFLSF